MKSHKPIIFCIFIILIGAYILFGSTNKEYELTAQDKEEILEVVNQYYESLECKDFYRALEYCDISKSDINMDIRVTALEELWENVIENFELEFPATKVDKYNDGYSKGFSIKVSLNLQYTNTIGGLVGEIVTVCKTDDGWKISKIKGLDRYGYYRTVNYQCDRMINFLNPKFTLSNE